MVYNKAVHIWRYGWALQHEVIIVSQEFVMFIDWRTYIANPRFGWVDAEISGGSWYCAAIIAVKRDLYKA